MIENKTKDEIEDCIAIIRSSLSLQMKELAEVIGISRSTLSVWIDGSYMSSVKEYRQLYSMVFLAKQWIKLTNKPLGRFLHTIYLDDKSLFVLMYENPIPTETILKLFPKIAKDVEQDFLLNEDPTSVRSLAEKHNLDLLNNFADQQDDMDLETGKRML